MERLIKHDWPGNIRELKNVIERAMLFCDEAAIEVSHLPGEFHGKKIDHNNGKIRGEYFITGVHK